MGHAHDSMSDQTVGHLFHESAITSAFYLDMLEHFMFPQITADTGGLIFTQDTALAQFVL
jgi:hypothetical protein